MIIHSVAPINNLLYDEGKEAFQYKKSPNGYIEGNNTADGFLVSRIISTNPKDYLDNNVFPGARITKW